MSRILVVEDHEDLAFGLETALENEGFEVVLALEGTSGLELARSGGIDLVVLDLMLPGLDGYRLLRALRAGEGAAADVPVLVLTARGEEVNKVQAFGIGADDYVTKPFGTLELIARVRALLRRAGSRGGAAIPAVERFGEIEVNPASRTVYRGGQTVSLAPREFDLLMALLRRHGAVASRADLLKEVWAYQPEVVSRTVDIHVAELRRKLETDSANPRHILTIWKVGYRLER
ncbi:MAG: response regulator transcription factor [Gemmatimonadota bacterium]